MRLSSFGLIVFVALFALAVAPPAFAAGAPEAREAARLNNCSPKKVEIYQQTIGHEGKTIYRVSCTAPKTTDSSAAKGPDALLIQCDGMLCVLLRPISVGSQ